MNAKHTPGPWHIEDSPKHPARLMGGIEGACHLADVFFTDLDLGLANARLIAAAPELLEACKRIREQLLETGTVNVLEGQRLVAAIAKAEGNS